MSTRSKYQGLSTSVKIKTLNEQINTTRENMKKIKELEKKCQQIDSKLKKDDNIIRSVTKEKNNNIHPNFIKEKTKVCSKRSVPLRTEGSNKLDQSSSNLDRKRVTTIKTIKNGNYENIKKEKTEKIPESNMNKYFETVRKYKYNQESNEKFEERTMKLLDEIFGENLENFNEDFYSLMSEKEHQIYFKNILKCLMIGRKSLTESNHATLSQVTKDISRIENTPEKKIQNSGNNQQYKVTDIKDYYQKTENLKGKYKVMKPYDKNK